MANLKDSSKHEEAKLKASEQARKNVLGKPAIFKWPAKAFDKYAPWEATGTLRYRATAMIENTITGSVGMAGFISAQAPR